MDSKIRSSNNPPEFLQSLQIRDLSLAKPQEEGSFEGFRLPGIIDLHIHGGFGWDFSFGDPDRIDEMLDKYLETGLTGVLATLITCSEDQRMKALADIHTVAIRRRRPPVILGVYLEGPFLAENRRGSHLAEYLLLPNVEHLKRWQKQAGGQIKMVTIAPELPGAFEFISVAQSMDVRPTMGHSDADHETAIKAIESGVENVTHFYNAMKPFSQRDPSIVSAVLTFKYLMVEMIADCIHVSPEIMEMSFSILGAERICFVSDAVSLTGLHEGFHKAYDRLLELKNGKCKTDEGHLFGGIQPLIRCIEGLHAKCKLPLTTISDCISGNPCRAVGVDMPRGDVILDTKFGWMATRLEDTWFWRE